MDSPSLVSVAEDSVVVVVVSVEGSVAAASPSSFFRPVLLQMLLTKSMFPLAVPSTLSTID